jgi:hypothetical protein
MASHLVRFQSASVCGVTENRTQHCSCCYHSIIADTMGTTLKRQLYVTVPQQSLNRFWIGLDANEEGCEAVTEIMKAESPQIIVHQFAIFVSVG